MATNPVQEMTIDELNSLIEAIVDRRLQNLLRPAETRSMEEINESIRRNRWTPPPGAKSSLELLRDEDTCVTIC